MDRKIVLYGYGDERPRLGFPTVEDFKTYIKSDIFEVNKGRHRYTQGKEADVVVLSRKGIVYGHFDVDDVVPPNDQDRRDYPPVKFVYLVRRAALYDNPQKLSELKMKTAGQFGRYLSEEEFNRVQDIAGPVSEYGPKTTNPAE
jgi:hypothetical protein